MSFRSTVWLVLATAGCSGSISADGAGASGGASPGGGPNDPPGAGEVVSFSEFVDEFYDPSACDSFVPCGDPVSGRFRYQSFQVCAEPDSDATAIDEAMQEVCSTGVEVNVQMSIEMEVDISGASCTGFANVAADIVLEISDTCIRELGGPSLASACPELEVGLQSEYPEASCAVRASACACAVPLYAYERGNCESFVIESACLDGDTLTFSDSGESAQPGIWTLSRVNDTSQRQEALSVAPAEPAALAARDSAEPLSSPARLLERLPAQRASVTAVAADALRGIRTR